MSTIVISGANRGIGLALVKHYRARDDRVVALCRSTSRELDASGASVIADVDVGDIDACARAYKKLRATGIDRINVLINNAGVLSRQRLGALDKDAIAEMEQQYRVNSLGPVLLTQALLPLLGHGSRVGIVTSRMGSVADNTSGGHYGYRMSKAAANIAGVSLANDLKDRGVAVCLLHPGYVRTQMTGNEGHIAADEAAAGLVSVLDSLSLDNSGRFWHASGEELPW